MLLSARLLATAALATRVPLAPRPVAVRARPLVCSGLQRPNSPPLPDHLEDMAEELESGGRSSLTCASRARCTKACLQSRSTCRSGAMHFLFRRCHELSCVLLLFYLQTFLFTHTYVYSLLSCCSELQQGIEPQGKDKTKLTYVHCAAGIRVHPASEFLQRMGFERVVPLQEGYASLLQYGFEPTFPGLK